MSPVDMTSQGPVPVYRGPKKSTHDSGPEPGENQPQDLQSTFTWTHVAIFQGLRRLSDERIYCRTKLICFYVLVAAGAHAPSRKEISHVLVRLLLRRDAKTTITTPSTRMPGTTSTHGKFSASNSFKKKHTPPSDLLKQNTKHKSTLETRLIPKQAQGVHTTTKLKGRTPTGPLSQPTPATLPFHLLFPLTTSLSLTVRAVTFTARPR